MSTWLKIWTHTDVEAQRTTVEKSKALANYMQQSLGVPFPTIADMVILRRKAKVIFDAYPHADWKTLCKIVDYCKSIRYRPNRAWAVLEKHREAWANGFAPELDYNFAPPAPDLDDAVAKALAIEQRPGWRRRLMMAQTVEQKKAVIEQWEQSSSTYQ